MKTLKIAVLAFFFAIATTTAAQERVYDLRLTPVTKRAAMEKSSKVSAPYCLGTYISDIIEEVKGGGEQRLAVLAVPAVCGTGFTYYGDFGSEVRAVQVEDVVFHLLQTRTDARSGGLVFAQMGSEVFVTDYRPIELTFRVGGERMKVSASAGATFLSGRIIGNASATQSAMSCGMSGCTEVTSWSGEGYLFVDRDWGSYPGTAAVNADGDIVGVVLGADGGRTLLIGASRLFNLMVKAGLVAGGKG